MTHEEKKAIAVMLLKENAEFLKKWLDHQAKFAHDVSPWEPLFLSIIKNVEAL